MGFARRARARSFRTGWTTAGLLAAWTVPGAGAGDAPERWYDAAQAAAGQAVYAEHCAACHGDAAEGQPGWEERGPGGYYPAPPLDGSGHSAEHSLEQMLDQLDVGGGPFGGWMPSFRDELDEPSKRAVLAYIQSLWPDEIYANWVDGAVARTEHQH